MDSEKQFQDLEPVKPHPVTVIRDAPLSIKLVRTVQYTCSTVSLVTIACAIDRNILVPGVSAEEKALVVSVGFRLSSNFNELHSLTRLCF